MDTFERNWFDHNFPVHLLRYLCLPATYNASSVSASFAGDDLKCLKLSTAAEQCFWIRASVRPRAELWGSDLQYCNSYACSVIPAEIPLRPLPHITCLPCSISFLLSYFQHHLWMSTVAYITSIPLVFAAALTLQYYLHPPVLPSPSSITFTLQYYLQH